MTPSITVVQSEFLEQDLMIPLAHSIRSECQEATTAPACAFAETRLEPVNDASTSERESLSVCIEELNEPGTINHLQEQIDELICGTATSLVRRRRFRPFRLAGALVKHASNWVNRRVNRTRAFLTHHWHLLRTGESATELVIVFSPIVAASSLAYLGPAACFFATKKIAMTALFSMITFTSLQADSLQPHNKLWCMTDRTIATIAVITGPVRTFLHAAATLDMKIKIAVLSTVALSFLAWSRSSKSQADFVLRHTCWHIVSAGGLSWMALRSAHLMQQYEAKLLLAMAEVVA